VWTGSFNLTAGAESNIENGMSITDPVIAAAFLAEFARVWALSEPLTFTAGTPTPGSAAAGTVRVPVKRARKATAKRKAPAKRATTAKKTVAKPTVTKKATPPSSTAGSRVGAAGKKPARTTTTRKTR
jgi:phosphatidylserine/phosphatidylglycerophosphate/cardiolipin synthase-like enzyme